MNASLLNIYYLIVCDQWMKTSWGSRGRRNSRGHYDYSEGRSSTLPSRTFEEDLAGVGVPRHYHRFSQEERFMVVLRGFLRRGPWWTD